MSFDYISDTFGKFRNRETPYTELEKEAFGLMSSFVNGSMSNKEFALAFKEVRRKFIELFDAAGRTFNEDTPLWLNSLLGFHFVDWYRYQQVKWYFEEHPDELVGDMKSEFEEIQAMGHDERFLRTCKSVLKELSSKGEEEEKLDLFED